MKKLLTVGAFGGIVYKNSYLFMFMRRRSL
nr:MAG TPA: hypothetical protein [Herelleviridae sp.]